MRHIFYLTYCIGACAIIALTHVSTTRVSGHHAQVALLEASYAPAPEGMVLVPPGAFLMGSDDPLADPDERPLRSIFLPGFYIDQHEVTHAAYAKYDEGHTYTPSQSNYPVTGLSLAEARAYAESLGKRLPTLAEWEKAARGTDGRLYPWGSEFQSGLANIGGGSDLMATGTHPESVSPYGVHDMTGNAWEWVDETFTDRSAFGTKSTTREIIKGGAFSYSAYQGRVSYNGFEAIGSTCNDIGFRCVLDAEPIEE